jgi:hypothetical protein
MVSEALCAFMQCRHVFVVYMSVHSRCACAIISLNALSPPCFVVPSSAAEEKVVNEPYDYIIAGGGLAGCVLAERLSQDGSKRVLVIEAGRPDYRATFIRIPAGILRLFRSVYDWQFETGGEKDSNGRNVFVQRGKVSCASTV